MLSSLVSRTDRLPVGLVRTAAGFSFYAVILLYIVLEGQERAAMVNVGYTLAVAISALTANWVEQGYIRFQEESEASSLMPLVVMACVLATPYIFYTLSSFMSLGALIAISLFCILESLQRIQTTKFVITSKMNYIANRIYLLRIIVEILGGMLILSVLSGNQQVVSIFIMLCISRLAGVGYWMQMSLPSIHSITKYARYGIPIAVLVSLPMLYTAHVLSILAAQGERSELINLFRFVSLAIGIPIGIQMVTLAPEIFRQSRTSEIHLFRIIKMGSKPIMLSFAVAAMGIVASSYFLYDSELLPLTLASVGSLMWLISLYIIKPFEIAGRTTTLAIIMLIVCIFSITMINLVDPALLISFHLFVFSIVIWPLGFLLNKTRKEFRQAT